MSQESLNDSMLETYMIETSGMVDDLENIILQNEEEKCYTDEVINKIFRIVHTVKGSSAMMSFNGIAELSHSLEDIFYFIREEKSQSVRCSNISDLILDNVDFIKKELDKIKNKEEANGDPSELIANNKKFFDSLKKQEFYKGIVFFQKDCGMENIRAYTAVETLKTISNDICYFPENILEDDDTCNTIKESGFKVFLKSDKSREEINKVFEAIVLLENFKISEITENEYVSITEKDKNRDINKIPVKEEKKENITSSAPSVINVNVNKVDKLMDLLGELVITEAMVIQNPDLRGLEITNFSKAATQLHKVIKELQDTVMDIRMVPLANVFAKMKRIVRDMSKKLDKDVELKLIGEETEVDKNIIEHIADPLMHLVRNSIDHGIEDREQRKRCGKTEKGLVVLEAKNLGSDVVIRIKDDGGGLDKNKILQKAKEKGLIGENEIVSDEKTCSLILEPGFSTNNEVTEFSGRGVGMDVVSRNIGDMGGRINVSSSEGKGTTIILKIPLTLAIIDGINVKVGKSYYTIPTLDIKEFFKPDSSKILSNMDGSEMITIRGRCYPVIRIHETYNLKTSVKNISDGILIMVEKNNKMTCIFADEIVGQQQVVIKSLPEYIKNNNNVKGLSGCTLLGDGNISLILDVGEFINASLKKV
ncbi:two-component system chemotaxis sensor kinase CheA [Clostridium acetobutylicum]|uniref:Chemotaxis protein CheA n=1 Tax=Clostridium acetobutylicum (strain ATCC 824 / DSM 792 / JCM 1419 / IAM 19013 / LMG 5710 / NBRC 13948 / NRRL B-527 / VKM B-1787 / 2291 / W) TaxID=272562 RepID=Q97MS3_CLOAB|nr:MULTISPECIES: chemotaxis protein CheA [Clostridium]AAK78103.1 Chemotaxis protein cheA [Clostridium acetobutylicum ATCC 824]ADZ19162.1 Chemotaxis protein cheA [Clostridium acetobutylicum EA 2018]AEI33570.1 chemotaxis protein cheA [Clostridium acetobutylicum DSM 1731]AWV81835.1 chemotaxis protein CheA [Clostridium acetobutylicum]MBC2395382.1 chemotaxis protein CheA [Clostridium acetobutylicum]